MFPAFLFLLSGFPPSCPFIILGRQVLEFRAFAEFANSAIDWVVIFKNHRDGFLLDEEDLSKGEHKLHYIFINPFKALCHFLNIM